MGFPVTERGAGVRGAPGSPGAGLVPPTPSPAPRLRAVVNLGSAQPAGPDSSPESGAFAAGAQTCSGSPALGAGSAGQAMVVGVQVSELGLSAPGERGGAGVGGWGGNGLEPGPPPRLHLCLWGGNFG